MVHGIQVQVCRISYASYGISLMYGPVTAPWVLSPHRQTDEQALCQSRGMPMRSIEMVNYCGRAALNPSRSAASLAERGRLFQSQTERGKIDSRCGGSIPKSAMLSTSKPRTRRERMCAFHTSLRGLNCSACLTQHTLELGSVH